MSKTIQFTDTSTNANTYFWDFGDGNTSTERNPIHTYQEDGEYIVVHTVFNDSGQASTEQTISLGTTQVDEQTFPLPEIDDTEPNPINPPSGYNPSQGEFLAGTISPQGQWIWNGQAWNVLEPEPSAPPIGYNPLQGQFQVGALSSNEQWVWDGYQWNLNVDVEEQEPLQEETVDEGISSYQITINEISEATNFDLINLRVIGDGGIPLPSDSTFTAGQQIELGLGFPNPGSNATPVGINIPSNIQIRPFITTPEDLDIELIEDDIITYDDGFEQRNVEYSFIMPNQNVEITARAFFSPQEDTEESEESDVDVDIPEEEDLGTGLGGDTDEQTQEGENLLAYNLTLNEESEGNLDLINFNVVSSEPYIEGNEIELVVFFVTGYDHSPFDVQLRPFITTPENLEIQLIDDNSYTFSSGQEGRDATYRFTMPSQDVSINAIAFLP